MSVKKFLLLSFIFNPSFLTYATGAAPALQDANDYNEQQALRLATEASLRSYERERAKAVPDDEKEDDDDLELALERSRWEHAQEQAKKKAPKDLLYAYLQRNLIKSETLFTKPDYKEWQRVYREIGQKESVTALNVILLLSDLKKIWPEDDHVKQLANHALLQIFSGCWGISNKRATPDMEQRLKDILREVGRSFFSAEYSDRFAHRIFNAFEENKIFRSNPYYNGHFITVFCCLSEGYANYPYELGALAEAGKLFFSKGGLISSQHFFAKTGYYPANHRVTLEDLIATARFRDPQFTPTAQQLQNLRKYLASFDPESPGISKNLDSIKMLWRMFRVQPAINESTFKTLHNLMFDEILKRVEEENRKVLTDITKESLWLRDFEGTADSAYEAALNLEKVKDKEPAGKALQELSEGLYDWLYSYIEAINEGNKIKQEVYYVYYGGRSYFHQLKLRQNPQVKSLIENLDVLVYSWIVGLINDDDLQQPANEYLNELEQLGATKNLDPGTVISWEHFSWLHQRIALPLAKAGVYQVPTGRIRNNLYSVLDDPSFAKRGRAVDYLIRKGKIDPSLKLPILLTLYNTMLD